MKNNINLVISIIALLISSSILIILVQRNQEFSIYDVNLDGKVDNADLGLVRDNIGTSNLQYDVNHDGKVNILDLTAIRNHFG